MLSCTSDVEPDVSNKITLSFMCVCLGMKTLPVAITP